MSSTPASLSEIFLPTAGTGFPNPDHPELLTPPVSRAAYSNRTAWVMANLSRMAYYKFEGNPDLIAAVAKKLADEHSADPGHVKHEIEEFLDRYTSVPAPGKTDLQNELGAAGFVLRQTFDRGGTQAFLATREEGRLAVLAFRGTEQNHDDIKTDLDFRFYKNADGSKSHEGFKKAFEQVEEDIKLAYRGLSDYRVYITGHSLGGALALIATQALDADKDICTDNLASCYTFGSPKVGTGDFADGLRAPVYRVVNSADAVPRLPPSYLLDIVSLLCRFVPVPFVRNLFASVKGYRHVGDMRYLTNATPPNYSDVTLIANPDFFDRALWTVQSLLKNWKAGYERHSIQEYCDKLAAYALKKTPPACPHTIAPHAAESSATDAPAVARQA